MRLLTICLVLGVALLLADASFGQGNDVYNFYFQKAPGPQTVNQGGAPPSGNYQIKDDSKAPDPSRPAETAPSSGAAAKSVATVENPEKKSEEFLKWSVRLGKGTRSFTYAVSYDNGWGNNHQSDLAQGTSIGGTYSWNKYFAADAELIFPGKERAKGGPYWEVEPPTNIFPYVGMLITPFRLSLFSHELMEFSLIAGLTSLGDGGSGRITTYLGLRYAINISNNFSMDVRARGTGAAGKFSEGNLAGSIEKFSETSLALAWKF